MSGVTFGPKTRQYAIVITVNFSILCTGMALSWSSPALVKLNATETVLSDPVSHDDGSWIVSAMFLTSTFVSLLSACLLDNLGRKYSVLLASVPHILGGLLIVFARHVWLLILARTFIGLSLAINLSVAPTYAAEIACKEIRGSLGTILQISCCLGSTLMLAIGPFVSYLALNLIYTSIVILTAIPMLFLPDSPYYLYSKGRTNEALQILIKVRGSESLAKQELSEYEQTKITSKVDHLTLFKDLIFLKTLFFVIIFSIITQLSGASITEVYLQPILETTKTNISSEVASAVVGLLKLVASVFTALITDRFGRKPILIWTYFGMAIGMVGFGASFTISSETKQMYTFINYIPLICLILAIYCNSAGQGSLYFTIITEMFEGPSRALGVSIAFFSASLFTFIVAKYLDIVLVLLGPTLTYWFFALFCILGAVFVMFCLPETKGKTFAEIQRKLGRKT